MVVDVVVVDLVSRLDFFVVVVYDLSRVNKSAEEKVRKLTQNQAKVLEAITFPSNQSFGTVVPGSYVSLATGLSQNGLGGTVSALQRNDIIMPIGRDGRQYNWELVDLDLIKAREEDPDALKHLLRRVSGEDR